ncbi:MAG: polysaccharide deacetylase family protein [Desulfatitalea sp.]|nr:polysaccharide deacetylase family protein [Desulfatitalea sp.]
MPKINLHRFLWVLLLWLVAACGCTGHLWSAPQSPELIQADGFVIVTATDQDSLDSLAQDHLGRADQAFRIATYNGIDRVAPGQRLVIPRTPLTVWGLRADGYQVVPILYYPRIDPDPDAGNTGAISSETLDRQMHYLRENGHVTVSLDQLHAFLARGAPLPPKAVIVTFDSARRWVHEIAYPILERHGHTAALFVPTAMIGQAPNMDWNALAAIAAAGWDIGVMGLGERNLTLIPSDTGTDIYLKLLEDEIRHSRQLLEDNLQRPCLDFAYPDGGTNDLIIALLKQYGYRSAFTRQPGHNPFFVHPFLVHRTVIDTETSDQRFQDALTTFIPVRLR